MAQLLVIAHPGHELLVYGRFATTLLKVMVLTDGGGGAGHPRISMTRDLVVRLGGEVCDLFGRHTDAAMYAAILAQDVELFGEMVDEVAAELMAPDIDGLISDAVEHYNPMHDLCSVIAQLAATRAAHQGKRLTRHLCPIVAPSPGEETCTQTLAPSAAALKRIDTARIGDLVSDLPQILEQRPDLMEEEVLIAADLTAPLLPSPVGPVFYETYGREQLAKRGGGDLITHAAHVQPLVVALERREQRLLQAREGPLEGSHPWRRAAI